MLKLKVTIADPDKEYLAMLSAKLNEKYGGGLEIAAFSDFDAALEACAKEACHVFLASDAFADGQERFPKKCAAGFLVSESYNSIHGVKAVRKYQKVDALYRDLRALYEESLDEAEVLIEGTADSSITVFVPASGGAGASTLAAACARSCAARGRDVLYLNMEDFGTSSTYFSGDGVDTLEKVLLALKMKKSNVSLALKGATRRDPSGVSFIESSANPRDIVGLTSDEIETLLREIVGMKQFAHIIVDVSMNPSNRMLAFVRYANRVFFVSNGTEVSNAKCKRLISALSALEQDGGFSLPARSYLLYNNVRSSTGSQLQGALPVAGGLPHYEISGQRELVEELAKHGLFETLLEEGGHGKR